MANWLLQPSASSAFFHKMPCSIDAGPFLSSFAVLMCLQLKVRPSQGQLAHLSPSDLYIMYGLAWCEATISLAHGSSRVGLRLVYEHNPPLTTPDSKLPDPSTMSPRECSWHSTRFSTGPFTTLALAYQIITRVASSLVA